MRDAHFAVSIKTSAPSLEGVIERKRLLDALAKLQAPAKWLQAPSGTGKSTLAASYARARKKPLVWYRLDERDNDPAFFYAEFGDAIKTQARLTEQLPKFSSDDHDRQHTFAQRFAAALSKTPPKATLFVLDDVQSITNESMQQALTALALATAKGHEVLFVSQSAPPTAFFDAIAARQLALLNDADLHFDLAECRAMISALRIRGEHGESIAALTGGHAGALILACELLRGTDPQSALGVETVGRVHTHLLTKLVERMPQARRELLLQTAFVSQLTRPIAEQLAGSDAVRELEALVDSGLLRRIKTDKLEMFEAHGLVRHGMQALVRTQLGANRAKLLAERTAATLLDNEQPEEALALLIDIGSTTQALEVVERLAKRYAAQGRVDLLLTAVAKLPRNEVECRAWLCFWTGQALLQVDEEQSRVWLGHSYAAFENRGDMNGMRLAAASVVTAFALECGDRRGLDAWVDRHRDAGGDEPVPADTLFEPSLIMGVACAAFVNASYPKKIDPDALIARLQSLLDLQKYWLSDDQRVQAARILIEQGHVFGKYELAKSVILATRSLIDKRIGSSLQRGRWLIIAAYAHFADADATRSLDYLSEAQLLAETSQSFQLAFELGLAFADYWMRAHDLPRAADELRRLEAIAVNAPPAQRAEHARLMTRLLLLQEHLPDGLRWAQEAKRLAVPAGFTGSNLRAFEIELVYALAANNRLADAIDLLKTQNFEPHQVRLAVEHCLRFLLSDRSDLQLLRVGLQNAAEIGFINLLERARTALVQICETALANDIETGFVHRLISAKHLIPTPLTGPHWPWPVKIKTLGGFRLDIQGQPYQPSHKAQEKPLELLKLLVTCQALGRDSAEKTWICERLWSDAEPDKARKSFDMTVGRLRRLLCNDDAVVLNEGRLQLSPLHVWTDIGPLRRALSHARVQRDEQITRQQSGRAAESISAVLAHYIGPFLAEEEGPAWLLAGREAIAAAVRHAMLTADALLDGSSDDQLIPALEKAFVFDPTSEDLARTLMRAHLRRGNNSEAIRVYRRLREMLSLLLSVAPSPDTEYFFNQAYTAESNRGDSSSVEHQRPSFPRGKKNALTKS